VTVNSTASITIGAPSPTSPQVGQTVAFALTYPPSTTGASPIVRVDVDWGDGRRESFNGTPSVVAHAYGSQGSFLVVVTGFDALGDSTSASQAVTVTPRTQPTVGITAFPASPAINQIVTFTITAAPTGTPPNPITSVSVDFGDGQSVTLPGNAVTVQHAYSTAGEKRVVATATDITGASGSGSIVIIVQGTPGPTANFTIAKATPPTLTINVDGSSSTGTGLSFQWNFGDNTSLQSGVTTSHTYALAGTYTITLTVTDNQNRTATTSKQVTVP
jgi:hypothetical protein